MSSSTIAIIITFITMILFFSNKFAMSVVSCAAALAMGILIPEMKLSQIYSGFGGSTVVMVAGMCIVGDALFQTGVAQKLGAKIAATPLAKNERVFIMSVVIICTLMSAFLSNSGTIAMWMPILHPSQQDPTERPFQDGNFPGRHCLYHWRWMYISRFRITAGR